MNGLQKTEQPLESVPSVKVLIGIEKKCSKCGEVKAVDDFGSHKTGKNGRSPCCRECERKRLRLWTEQNRERKNEKNTIYRKNNLKKCKDATKKWDKLNKEKKRLNSKKFRDNNPERSKEIQRKSQALRRANPKNRISSNISREMNKTLKNGKSGRHWEILVDYTLPQLISHLENQFCNGMTWENYGKWHIDHKIPLSAHNFTTQNDIDFKKCWALSNLQPLWAKDNMSKHDKLTKPFQPALIIGV